MKTLRQIRSEYETALTSLYGEAEALSLFYWAAEEILGVSRTALLSRWEEIVSEPTKSLFDATLRRLKKGEPIQYVFNKACFAGLELYVDSFVLIPRPETEELYMWAVEEFRRMLKNGMVKSESDVRIMDLCTGSGALAIALSKAFPKAEVYGCDISQEALAVAERNNTACGTSVQFFAYNVLGGEPLPPSVLSNFDLIISNPPYVRPSEKVQMRKNVLDFEPDLALFVPEENPLVFYKAIAALAAKYLRPGGIVMEEINEAFPEENKSVLQEKGFVNICVREDMQGKNRMICALHAV